jgi:hypothetical protein
MFYSHAILITVQHIQPLANLVARVDVGTLGNQPLHRRLVSSCIQLIYQLLRPLLEHSPIAVAYILRSAQFM